MMTREETIATLEESKRQNKIMIDNPTTFWASYQMADGVKSAKRRIEALDYALSALRPVSREQVEKVWRGEWIKHNGYTECSKCEYWYPSTEDEEEDDRNSFCPACGRAMTDEAGDILLKRLEALKDGL